jgi:hypothetical protein
MEFVIVKRYRTSDVLGDLIGPFDDVDQAREFKSFLRGADPDEKFIYAVVPLMSPVDAAPSTPPPSASRV